MNRIFYFLVVILLVFAIDLFHFEAPQSAFQDVNVRVVTEALADFNSDAVIPNLGFGFKPEFNSQKGDDTSSVSPSQYFDPVTLLLLGNGLIGLAGLGRKKI